MIRDRPGQETDDEPARIRRFLNAPRRAAAGGHSLALDTSKAEIARLIEVLRQTLHDILAEKQDVTPTMALRIGKLTGLRQRYGATLQRNYDLCVPAVKDADIIARILTLEAA